MTTASSAQDTVTNENRTRWLAGRIVRLDNLSDENSEPARRSFLEPLSEVDIVAFGEPTHGDGSAFVIRNQLTRLLYEQADFNTLALEALGLFDRPQAIDSNAAWVWSGSAEARPGLDFALSGSGDVPPMRVSGIDVQHGSVDARWKEVEQNLLRIDALDENWSVVKSVLNQAFSNPFTPVDSLLQTRIRQAVSEYESKMEGAGDTSSAVFLANALANVASVWEQRNKPRDYQMGQNLLFLNSEKGKDGRIVLWAATSHALKSLSAIDNLDPDWSYDEDHPLGEIADQALHDKYYIIAFSACKGTYGASHIGLSIKTIEQPEPGSLEALICDASFSEAAFVDLRNLSKTKEGGWLLSPLIARPLGYRNMLASWPTVLDGLIVVREMQASTPNEN